MRWEAARVLRPGGRFVVTTPNIVSYRSLALAHRGGADQDALGSRLFLFFFGALLRRGSVLL